MRRRPLVLIVGLPIIAIAAMVSAALSIAKSNRQASSAAADRPMRTSLPADEHKAGVRVGEVIGAAGIVEPSTEAIYIGSGVSGIVTEVLVKPNSVVDRGTVLFRVDSRLARSVLAQRKRDLQAAQARLAEARARVPELMADIKVAGTAIEAARARRDDAADMVRIAGRLGKKAFISTRERTKRQNELRAAEASLLTAKAKLEKATAKLEMYQESKGGAAIVVHHAAVEQARAAVELAESELDVRTIRAPISGTILQVKIQPGEFAQAGASTEPLMVMGQIKRLNVRVDIDESEIPRWRQRADARAFLRGPARSAFRLEFVRQEPLLVPKNALSDSATERVDTRVMQVVYRVVSKRQQLMIGQQLDVYIGVEKKSQQARIAPTTSSTIVN